MERARLAREVRYVALLHGRFVLRSVAVSAIYWDKYRFESNPIQLAAISCAVRSVFTMAELERIAHPRNE